MKSGERFYRDYRETGRWKACRVKIESTDIYIRSTVDVSEPAEIIVRSLRKQIQDHIAVQPEFLTSLNPIHMIEPCPPIIRSLYASSAAAGVGPLACVAGAISDFLGGELKNLSQELLIENGGDIWLTLREPAHVSIYAGRSPFSGTIAIKIRPDKTPLGICTSSGRIGHSLSFGRADAVTVFSPSAALADAVATGTGNLIRSEDDISGALRFAMNTAGVSGVIILFGDTLAVQGDVELADPVEAA